MERRHYISLAYWARDRHEQLEPAEADTGNIVNIADAFGEMGLRAVTDSSVQGPEMPEAA